jgi:hypothetical protein
MLCAVFTNISAALTDKLLKILLNQFPVVDLL